jgi:D-alanyl-D-alanine carboxypeptidase (penicillin-binding protein 5/6)
MSTVAPRTRGPRHRARRSRRSLWVAALAVVTVAGVLGGLAQIRLSAGPPTATVRAALGPTRTVPGSAAVPPWPAGVQVAFSVPVLGVSGQSGPEQAEPVASLTKTMTAYLILKDHPLTAEAQGPSLTMSAADVADWDHDVDTDQSNVEVATGEVLTERQLLEGLLVHSANNFADTLAEWDAGTVAAFVTKMNATAQVLGMTHSHFVDPSGFDQQSESTPADLLKVVRLDMEFPVFAQTVTMPSVTLPVAGTVFSATPLVGIPGIVGVKSGFTMAAGGCDVLALLDRVDGQLIVVLAAVTGEQQGATPVAVAAEAALALAKSVAGQIVGVRLVRQGAVLARASVVGTTTAAAATSGLVLLGWPGQAVRARFTPARAPLAGARAGTLVGRASFSVAGERGTVEVKTRRALPRPTVFQRLL